MTSVTPVVPGDRPMLDWLGALAGTAISILLAMLALTHGLRRHRSLQPLLLAALGFAALLGARIALEGSLLGEMVLSASGGLLVVAAHLINRSLCLTCGTCRLSDEANAGPCRGEEL